MLVSSGPAEIKMADALNQFQFSFALDSPVIMFPDPICFDHSPVIIPTPFSNADSRMIPFPFISMYLESPNIPLFAKHSPSS